MPATAPNVAWRVGLKCMLGQGLQANGALLLQARVKFHVLLTTYEMVGSEAGTLRSLEYETLIVDEGHRLKNQESKLFQQLHNFKTRQRTLLTGTPLQNNLAELWMLLHFLDAGKFQSLEQFQADFSDFSQGDQVC